MKLRVIKESDRNMSQQRMRTAYRFRYSTGRTHIYDRLFDPSG